MINLINPQKKAINFDKLEILFQNILEYFYDAYISMTKEMPFQYNREDDINDKLYLSVIRLLEEKNITTIRLIPQAYNPEQRETHNRASQVDFLVMWSLDTKDRDRQFYIECKLLNCNGKNREYINNGINRFTTNFYSKELPFAGMIGYIERGESLSIINDLSNKIGSNMILDNERYFKSVHERDNQNIPIALYHLLLDFRDCQDDPINQRPCPNNNMSLSSPIL